MFRRAQYRSTDHDEEEPLTISPCRLSVSWYRRLVFIDSFFRLLFVVAAVFVAVNNRLVFVPFPLSVAASSQAKKKKREKALHLFSQAGRQANLIKNRLCFKSSLLVSYTTSLTTDDYYSI